MMRPLSCMSHLKVMSDVDGSEIESIGVYDNGGQAITLNVLTSQLIFTLPGVQDRNCINVSDHDPVV